MKKIFLGLLISLCLFSCDDDPTLDSCSTPTNITILNITTELVDISWSSSLDENTGYEIVIGPSGFGIDEGQISMSSGTNIIITGLAGGTEYDFFLRTICNNQNTSAWTEVQTFTTLAACSEITSTNVSNITETAALIRWEYAGNFPISFIIEYGEEGFTLGDGIVAETSITNIPLMNLMKGINYHYYLTAKCTGDNLGERFGPFSFSTLE